MDLEHWQICDPELREDKLPQPFALISQILQETVLHHLDRAMFEINEKQNDGNYEGSVPDYFSQNLLDIDGVSCVSSNSNPHNHLLAGDKKGTLFLLDLAKKVVFSKRELVPGKRVVFIAESLLTDSDSIFTTAAIILNRHPSIYIVCYKHGEQKLTLTYQIKVSSSDQHCSKMPYACQWDDYSRLLLVYTYQGSIILYRIPQIFIDIDAINRNQAIPLEQEEFKKKLRYPLNYATFEQKTIQIKQPLLKLPFTGTQKIAESPPNQGDVINGEDNSLSQSLPFYQPFATVLHSRAELPKNKTFQKGRFIDIPQKLIYGWTNTRELSVINLFSKATVNCPTHIYLSYFMQKISPAQVKRRKDQLEEKIVVSSTKIIKNISTITCTALSENELYFAVGMANGSTIIWSTSSFNTILSTCKHQGPVSALRFFQNWKLVSGSSAGSLHIDNLLTQANEVKLTNVFNLKDRTPIQHIFVSHLGLCFVLDLNSNIRVYDLWRNEKIAKLQASNAFANLQNKGKRWLSGVSTVPSTPLYSNNDFTVLISASWPNYTYRELEESAQKKNLVEKLRANSWKCESTHLHILRNFELLLTLFEGLESVYKKGYDRKKVQNLFSNLQFPQLYDRNFQIPDFQVNSKQEFKKAETRFFQTNKSQKSSKSKERLVKQNSSLGSQASKGRLGPGLTNEVLHPEKFLLERRRVRGMEVLNNEKLQGHLMESYRRQSALQNALQNTLSKGLL